MSPKEQLDVETVKRLALSARAALPEPFRALAGEVGLACLDRATDEMLDALDIADPLDLTGLYEGTPLPEKSVMDAVPSGDVIWLFSDAILAEWRDRGDVSLADLVAHVYVHELAHHLGWSDDEIAAIDPWWT
ncbi:MAG: metallopeptidase family protein [Pseudomonadota bacterium]